MQFAFPCIVCEVFAVIHAITGYASEYGAFLEVCGAIFAFVMLWIGLLTKIVGLKTAKILYLAKLAEFQAFKKSPLCNQIVT